MTAPDLWQQSGSTLTFSPHPGQYAALEAAARFVLVLAGTQGGKTVLGPLWLLQEMQRRGIGDYLVVAPSYPLLNKKVLPEFTRLFVDTLHLGEYKVGERVFKAHDGSQVFFGHASDPDSLESATARAAWLDEAGQDGFRLGSWEAIQRRLSIHQGRVLITTTPYNLGWLKSEVYDRWTSGDKNYQVVQFRSNQNPAFPQAEFERARETLPDWKFRMFYLAEFTRPAGMIYDCLEDGHYIAPFAIPDTWNIYGGMDFGGVHTAALRIVENPTSGALYVTDEYMAGGRTAAQHAEALKSWNVSYWIGGSPSEGQWRQEFQAAGLPMAGPSIKEVEVGINRVYGLLQGRKLYIYNTCNHLRAELGAYSRVLDGNGQSTEVIANKNEYHYTDALRYGVQCVTDRGWLLA